MITAYAFIAPWMDHAWAGASPGGDPVVPLTEGFESGLSVFTPSCIAVGNCIWRPVDSAAHTGAYSIHVDDLPSPGESSVEAPTLAIPGNASAATLTFWHMYDFEVVNFVEYDGGVIEVSTDDGRTWADAGENVLLNGYTGTIAERTDTNPLRGRAAWVARSGAWSEVMLDLMPYRGGSVTFRLRLGTDLSNLGSPGGWWVDDIQVSYSAPSTDCGRAWSTVSPYPADVDDVAAVGLAERIYVFGGGMVSAPFGSVASAYSYSTQDDTWTPIAALPEPRRRAMAVTDGESIYILGGVGFGTQPTSTVWRYDPAANNYITLSPLPTAATRHAGAYLDGRIYRIGGHEPDGESGTNTVDVYSIEDNSWSDAADHPRSLFSLSAVAFGGFLYTAGGDPSDDSDPTNKTYRYDPPGDLWDDGPISDVPTAVAENAAALYRDTWILARRGLPFAWDPPANRWRSLDEAPHRVVQPAAAATDAGFYIIAGVRGASDNTIVVQRYSEAPCTTPTPTVTPSTGATATRTQSGEPGCLGDCDGDDAVAIADLVKGVAIALGLQPLAACLAMDGDQDGAVAINELVQAVNHALSACG